MKFTKAHQKMFPNLIWKEIRNKNYEKWFSKIGLDDFNVLVNPNFTKNVKLALSKFDRTFVNSLSLDEDDILDNIIDSSFMSDLFERNKCYSNRLLESIKSLRDAYNSNDSYIIRNRKKFSNDFKKSFLALKYSVCEDDCFMDGANAFNNNLKIKRFRKPEKKGYRVVFKVNGNEGAYNIATMSMRGIASCMSWFDDHSNSLIGSLLDPCCGVIYLTDGRETPLGERMIGRSVVRIVYDNQANKYVILLEPCYKMLNQLSIDTIQQLFVNSIKKNLKNSNTVVLADNRNSYYANRYCRHHAFRYLNVNASYSDARLEFIYNPKTLYQINKQFAEDSKK